MARKKGTGTVWVDGDRWEGEITVGRDVGGKRIRRSASGDSPEAVFAELARLRDEYLAEQDKAAQAAVEALNRLSISTLADRWLSSVKMQVSGRTYDRYALDLTYCLPLIGHVPAADLRPFSVEEMYRAGEAAGFTRYQLHKGGKALRRVMDYAARHGYAATNAAVLVKLPTYSKEEIHPLDREQVQALLTTTAESRLAALYILAIDSGARQGELFALEWSDWFPASREVSITKAVSEWKGRLVLKEPKTKASRRRVYITERTAAALEAHRAKMTAEGQQGSLMFPDADGKWLRCSNFHRDHWQPALKGAGLPKIRFHDLRHTCATLLLQAGDNLKSISDRLGHASTEMVLRTYGHVVPQVRKESARIMDSLL